MKSAQTLPTARELELDLGYITIAAKAWGNEDGLPVLALHGWLDNANSFDRLAPHLDGIHLVAVDTVGHGRSGHRPAGVYYHLIDHVSDMLAVVDVLGWEQFDLLGHSMGGVLSTLLAGSFPQRVRRLALIESLGPFTNKDADAPAQLGKAIRQMGALAGKSMPHYPTEEDAVQARLKGFGTISEDAARKLVERGLVRDRDGYTWSTDPRLTLASSMRLTEDMVAAYLKAITIPTLLVLGDASYFPTYEQHKARMEHLIQLTVRSFSGGHHLHMESAADEIGPLLRQFFHSEEGVPA